MQLVRETLDSLSVPLPSPTMAQLQGMYRLCPVKYPWWMSSLFDGFRKGMTYPACGTQGVPL